MKRLEDHISLLRGKADPDLCDTIIREYESNSFWSGAKITMQHKLPNEDQRRLCSRLPISNEMVMSESATGRDLDHKLFELFSGLMEEWVCGGRKYCNPSHDEGYELLRYNPGEHYDFHVDAGAQGLDPRLLSIILNLSEASSYEGGDLEFEDGPKFSLDRGDIVLFPSNYLYPHRITPVTQGTRYSIVTWFQ